jgi:hypothetical protein
MIESMPAHNFDAENAVDADGGVGEIVSAEIASLPWADADVVSEPAEKPEVVRQFEVLQARVEAPVEFPAEFEAEPAPEMVAPPTPKANVRRSSVRRAPIDANQRDKAAFTLRLDAERHLRLRLASAIYNRSSQQILIDVLDNYLSALPEIDAMASRLPASPTQRKSANRTSDGE